MSLYHGPKAAKWFFATTLFLLGLMALDVLASTPLTRFDLRRWGRRSNIPLRGGGKAVGSFPGGVDPAAPVVPVYSTTNRAKNPETLRVLFIGNRLTGENSFASVLSKMGTKGKIKVSATMCAYDGYTLRAHLGDMRTYQAMTNVIPDRNDFQNALPLDAIIMQEHTTLAAYNWIQMRTNVAMLNQTITNMNSQGMLFMTWSRPDAIFDRAEFMDRTDGAYSAIGKQFGMPVVPAGRAWELSEFVRPDIVLRQSDGYTPTIYGTYLNACIFYAYLTWQSPIGLSTGGLWAIKSDEAVFLQDIAWAIFQWRQDGLISW